MTVKMVNCIGCMYSTLYCKRINAFVCNPPNSSCKGWDFYRQAGMQDEHFSKEVRYQLIKMDPKVECTTDSMKLQVQDVASTPGSPIWVDRGMFSALEYFTSNAKKYSISHQF